MSGAPDSLSFAFATLADDGDIRRLLRENPMRGAIEVGFAHEPGYFHGTGLAGATDRTLIARERGRLVAAGRWVISDRWLNGEIRRIAYLGELRLDSSVQGRADIVLRGYRHLAGEYVRDPADFCFTSIVADNERARRMLERGVRGMPRYELIAEFTTMLMRASASRSARLPPGLAIESGETVSAKDLADCLSEFGRTRNLSTHWTAERIDALAAHGLPRSDFLLLREGARLAGCMAVWDQRSFRQIVVHGYNGGLAIARPVVNLAGAVLGLPRLPKPGSILSQAMLSPMAIDPRLSNALPAFLREGMRAAARRGLEIVATGFAVDDPCWPVVVRAFRGRRYASRLYSVEWPGAPAVYRLDARPCLPELASL
ncbi:MAG TPA: hypothetical protein VMM36_00280 [Opitutaceae bacterium]|nr:hypothetical protein [Opitutaceae bacterium]